MKYESLMFRLSPEGYWEWVEGSNERRAKVYAEKIVREHLDEPELWDMVCDVRVPEEHRERVKAYLAQFRENLRRKARR